MKKLNESIRGFRTGYKRDIIIVSYKAWCVSSILTCAQLFQGNYENLGFLPFFPCVLSFFLGQADEVPESPSSPTNLYNFLSLTRNASLEICVPQRTIERELCLKDPLFILNAHFGNTFGPLLLMGGNVSNIRVWCTL